MATLFTAISAQHGQEIWLSYGSPSTTMLLKDVRSGSSSSNPLLLGHLLVAGVADARRVLFLADDGQSGAEIWLTDGTVVGTFLFIDLNQGSESSFASPWIALDGKAVFTANTLTGGTELWVTDGSPTGTTQLADILAGPDGSNPELLGYLIVDGVEDRSRVMFVLDDGTRGREIWVTDGSQLGTYLLRDINSEGDASPTTWFGVNGHAVFGANDVDSGRELWSSDGSGVTTALLLDAAPGLSSSDPEILGYLLVSGVADFTRLLVSLDDITHGRELWITDGTTTGTQLFVDIEPGSFGSAPTAWTSVGSGAVFVASTAATGRELWTSNGTSDGTRILLDARPGHIGSDPIVIGNLIINGTIDYKKILVQLDDGNHGSELWITDGTTIGTSLFLDINTGNGSSNPSQWSFVNGRAVFVASTDAVGSELWMSDGTPQGTSLLIDANPGVLGSNPTLIGYLTIDGVTDLSRLLFLMDDGTHGPEPWVTDGTPAGTKLFMDLNTGTAGSYALPGIEVLPTAFAIEPLDSIKSEGQSGSTSYTFTVTRSGATNLASTANWVVMGSGNDVADAGDFVGNALPSGTVSFASGETDKLVTVLVSGDTDVEATEQFLVAISNTTPGTDNGTATAIGIIQNDDASLAITATSTVKAEGNASHTAFTFSVIRTGAVNQVSTANWSVTGSGSNPAVAADFVGNTLPSGTLTYAAYQTSQTISVLVVGDTSVEPDEGFTVTLNSPSIGALIGTGSASGIITNDDALPLWAHDDAYTMLRGGALDIPLARGVLANDTGAASVSVVAAPSHGGLTLQPDGSFLYVPTSSFSGVDQFTYRAASSGATTDDADVTLHVIPVVVGASTTLGLVSLTPQEQIAATYVAFFGRGADRGGFNFWVDQFAKNLPTQGAATLFANIASSFAVGDEAKALYPFLANPAGASNAQIEAFLSKVYDNLFNRTPDAEGLTYWRGEIQNTLKAGQFVGSVLVNIMSGAQNSPAGQDITTLMSKVAVSLEYVQQQGLYGTEWTWADDQAEAMALLDPVGDVPETLLIGMANAQALVLADLVA